jgi:hypothetical protein
MTYLDNSMSIKQLVATQRKLYKTFVPVRCHILKEEVNFNFAGFEHLHSDGRKKLRVEKDARARLLLLEHAPTAITQSRFVKEDIKSSSETYSGKVEKYYELYAKVGIKQMSVVATVRRIGEGSLHFYGIRYKRKRPLTRS